MDGFTYSRKLFDADGKLVFSDPAPIHNLLPSEALTLGLSVLLGKAPQPAGWYVGMFENAYTPTKDLTAATLQALAKEMVSFSQAARPDFVPGAVTEGAADNSASLAVFNFTAAKRVHGSFLSTSPAKGSNVGTILSIVRYPSPLDVAAGFKLELLVAPSLISITA